MQPPNLDDALCPGPGRGAGRVARLSRLFSFDDRPPGASGLSGENARE
jgi:hypothetical protein